MESCDKLFLKANNGEIFEFNSKFKNFSELISSIPDSESEIPLDVDTKLLSFVKQFCELHHYEESSMTYRFPFDSVILKDHIDLISYKLFSPLQDIQIEENAKFLSDILETAFYLGFSKLKKITNVVLQIHFHCGDTEAELMKYKEKWGIGDKDQCPLTRHKIKMENEQLFKMLKEKQIEKIEEIFKGINF